MRKKVKYIITRTKLGVDSGHLAKTHTKVGLWEVVCLRGGV